MSNLIGGLLSYLTSGERSLCLGGLYLGGLRLGLRLGLILLSGEYLLGGLLRGLNLLGGLSLRPLGLSRLGEALRSLGGEPGLAMKKLTVSSTSSVTLMLSGISVEEAW